MPFELKILGSNSATPVFNRHQSSQLLQIENEYFLIDCGEATQHQLIRFKIKFNKINHIFISHLHGDHVLGLPGLISTMHLNGRQRELHLYGPPGLNEILTLQLKYSETILSYDIHFHELDAKESKTILDLDNLTVQTIPLNHRIDCCGFLFKEKPKKRRINKETLPPETSLLNIIKLKNGEDVYEGEKLVLKNEEMTFPPRKSRSFAYCSDTRYTETILPMIKDIDLLYHESTFLDDMKERAIETFHTTALEAATLAKKANVKRLIIGHFSSRYKELEPLLEEAKTVFTNSSLAIEGNNFSVSDD
ncbi:MAG: ribonuclease Z [Cytophagaceae bacterium]|nr:ribonuclease Z [Cytophagaceae bacterium]